MDFDVTILLPWTSYFVFKFDVKSVLCELTRILLLIMGYYFIKSF